MNPSACSSRPTSKTCPEMNAVFHSRIAGGHVAHGRQRGVSIITAIFLLSVLAMLGAFVVSVAGFQQKSSQLDI